MNWNMLSPAINESPRDNLLTVRGKPMPPETIGGVFVRYAVFLGMFAGIGRMGEAIPDRIIGTLVSTFGIATFVALAAAMFYEWRHTERKWKLYEAVERARENLPPAGSQDAPAAEKPAVGATITLRKENPTGYIERTIKIPNPPSAAFVVAVYRSQNPSMGGRIPGERHFENLFKDKADGWMSTLEELGIIEKVWPHETSPRRWTGAIALNQVLQAFGYEPIEEPPQQPPQPEKVRAQPPATPKTGTKQA